MQQAFVQHAEHDVDRDQRRGDQQRLGAVAVLQPPRVAGEFGADVSAACADRRRLSAPPPRRRPSAMPGARLKLSVAAGNWPWWRTASGASPRSKCAIADSGTCAPLLDADIDAVQHRRARSAAPDRSPPPPCTGCAACRSSRPDAARTRCSARCRSSVALTPSRAAASRSITTFSCGPARSWSEVTSVTPGVAFSLSSSSWPQWRSVGKVLADHHELELRSAACVRRRANPAPRTGTSGCRRDRPASAAAGRSPPRTRCARWSQRLQADLKLPAIERAPAAGHADLRADRRHRRIGQQHIDDGALPLPPSP